jgi:hypothetical protein
MRAELEVANLALHLMDGQDVRSYGNTCCDTSLGSEASQQPLESILRDMFVAARGALTNQIAQPQHGLNLFNVGCRDVAGRSLESLQDLIEQARESAGWAVLMIHGVGAGTHDRHLEADVHEHFIRWLAEQKTIWTRPVREIAAYIKQRPESPVARWQ